MGRNNTDIAFLELIRKGIGHSSCSLPEDIDWNALAVLSEKQGLSAIVVDGIERLQDRERPPRALLLQWIGGTFQGYEYRFEQYCHALAELSSWYKAHGFKMMVLKGYGCSLNWPKPEHRPCGDIDIWLFGKQKDADKLLKLEKGIDVENDRQHHTVFLWGDFMVENHFDFLDVYHHKSNVRLEKIFKELSKDDTHFIDIYGEKVYLPSPSMHALFLLKHMMSHFAAEGITLRQIMDWGFFVEKQGVKVDWDWLLDTMDRFGMINAYNVFNAICVEDLGFSSAIFPLVQFNPFMKDRVLEDILHPEYAEKLPSSLIPRVVYKIRRWLGNSWKHELCYKESLWSAFWSGVYNHLRKPRTI